VGIPSWLRESNDPSPGHNYFFVHITPAAGSSKAARPEGAADSASLGSGVLSDHLPAAAANGEAAAAGAETAAAQRDVQACAPQLLHKSPIPDLVLGPLLGKGGYGKVFRGLHKGQEVAVKVRVGGAVEATFV
jgi:hypothetical protein